MATTLNITPTLKGEESKKFNARIANSKTNKLSESKKQKIFALVGKITERKG